MNIRLGTARTITIGPILDAAGVAKTDEVVASILASKNGGAYAPLDGAATLTHSQTGYYRLALTAADVSALGCLEISLNSGTNTMQPVRLNVATALAWDAMYATSGGRIMADQRSILGTDLPAESVAGRDAAALGKLLDVETPLLTCAAAMRGTEGANTVAPLDATQTQTAAAAAIAEVIPHPIAMGQLNGAGAWYVEALTSGGAVIHASGAAVAKSPATLAAADVSGNLPADAKLIEGADATDAIQTAAAAAITAAAIPTGTVTALGTGSTLTACLTAAGFATPTNITAASGVSLAATGLDAITVTRPAGKATTFPQMLVQLFYRFFGKATKTATQIKTYAANGTTVVTTQTISDDGTTETQGEAS